MQIFCPYSDFGLIVECLDNKRLNKQKVEIYQILNCISRGENAKGWKNHPAVSMVRGYELFFINYGLTIADKCISNGWKDTLKSKLLKFNEIFGTKVVVPFYWGDERLHATMRSNLLRKDPIWYGQFGWAEPDNLPYFWPTKNGY